MSNQTSASNRINALLDENSFVEVGAYITARSTDFNMAAKETPADGVITGYGTIEGNLVYVYSQDASVLGGSLGEMQSFAFPFTIPIALSWQASAQAPQPLHFSSLMCIILRIIVSSPLFFEFM